MSNTDHVKTARILDRVTIICPLPADRRHYEYSKLYMVSKEGYENCELLSSKLIGSCETPERHSSISLVFRDFSPLPSALEFKPGRSYYIISTSNGSRSGLDNSFNGLCAQKHMKIRFDILSDDVAKDASSGAFSESQISTASTGEADASLMYIIHTVDPETIPSEKNAQILEKNEPDSASVSSKSMFLFLACFLLTLNLPFRLFF
uniref:Ephrin RBD domain-containing protein n=1 Tax=Panagrolaimus sp. JU765 TaxID=591449 RepID=A0AC34RID2_9BILA